jgi:hypothetical protein
MRTEGWDQRKDMRRRVIMVVLHSTLYRKFETYFPRNETARPPIFYIHVSGSYLYIPTIVLIWNLYLTVLHERTLGSTSGAKRRAGNCHHGTNSARLCSLSGT